jgi:hypothetical protein
VHAGKSGIGLIRSVCLTHLLTSAAHSNRTRKRLRQTQVSSPKSRCMLIVPASFHKPEVRILFRNAIKL